MKGPYFCRSLLSLKSAPRDTEPLACRPERLLMGSILQDLGTRCCSNSFKRLPGTFILLINYTNILYMYNMASIWSFRMLMCYIGCIIIQILLAPLRADLHGMLGPRIA